MKIRSLYDSLEEITSGLIIVAGLSLVFYAAIKRFVFNATPVWGEEYSVYLVLWGALLGCSVTQREGRHITVNFIYDLMPSRIKHLLNIISLVVSAGFCIVWSFSGFMLVKMYIRTGWVSLNSETPLWIVYLIVPISGLLLLNRFIQQLFTVILKDKL